jgi:predicted Rossmann-fold nucleotide-binding protein
MKTIIAGSRNIRATLYDIAKAVNASGFAITEVVSGGAKGIDRLGENWALAHNIPVKQFFPDWKNLDTPNAIVKSNQYGQYNALAGFDRNEKMAEYAEALIAIWDGSSNGTKDMITRMINHGKRFHVELMGVLSVKEVTNTLVEISKPKKIERFKLQVQKKNVIDRKITFE